MAGRDGWLAAGPACHADSTTRHAGAAAHETQATLTGRPPAHLRAHDALAAEEVGLPAVHVHAAALALQGGRYEAVEASARWGGVRLSGSGGEQAGQRHCGGRWHALGAGHLHGTCPAQPSRAACRRRTGGRADASTECACSQAGCLQEQHTLEAPLVRPISSAITCAAVMSGYKEVCIACLVGNAQSGRPTAAAQRNQQLRNQLRSSNLGSCCGGIKLAPSTHRQHCRSVCCGTLAAEQLFKPQTYPLATKHPPPARCRRA